MNSLLTTRLKRNVAPAKVRVQLTTVQSRVKVVKSPYEAATGAAAVVIATEWDVFRCDQLDYRRVYEGMNKPAYLFDGQLIIDEKAVKAIGFKVEVIGKGGGRRRELFE